jgi:secreted trypsin-like serine protease
VTEPVQDIAIEQKFPHPQYYPQTANQHNDIALLRLASKVRYTDYIKPICLPRTDALKRKDYVGIPLTVAGWGKTETASASNIKLYVDVDGVGGNQCNQVYRSEGVQIVNSQICAGGVPGKDSCRGDSGGKLLFVGFDEKFLKTTFEFQDL